MAIYYNEYSSEKPQSIIYNYQIKAGGLTYEISDDDFRYNKAIKLVVSTKEGDLEYRLNFTDDSIVIEERYGSNSKQVSELVLFDHMAINSQDDDEYRHHKQKKLNLIVDTDNEFYDNEFYDDE